MSGDVDEEAILVRDDWENASAPNFRKSGLVDIVARCTLVIGL